MSDLTTPILATKPAFLELLQLSVTVGTGNDEGMVPGVIHRDRRHLMLCILLWRSPGRTGTLTCHHKDR